MESRTQNNHNGSLDELIKSSYLELEEKNPPNISPPSDEQSKEKTAAESALLNEAAKAAVKEVGPQVYTLEGFNDEKQVRFFVIGCQGNGKLSQEAVAKLMNDIAASGQKPDFVLVLGDNIYDYGVDKPDHKGFDDCFHKKYGIEELSDLCGVPFFVIPGNHDANIHRASNLSSNKPGEATLINQTAHSYLPGGIFKTVIDKIKLYSSKILNLKILPQWNMPYFYYSLIAGDKQIICINSNTILKDFLEYKKNPANQDNQVAWLKQVYEEARQRGVEIIIASHIGLLTTGKRALKPDSHNFLDKNQLAELNKYFNSNTESYNELLALMLKELGIDPDLVLAAHDHHINYIKKNNLCQCIFGGSGGDLQKRMIFTEQKNTGCSLKKHGFGIISYIRKKLGFDIDIHTTEIPYLPFPEEEKAKKQHHLKFNSDSPIPLRDDSNDPELEILREIFLKACDEFYLLKNNKLASEKKEKTEPASGMSYLGHFNKMTYGLPGKAFDLASGMVSNLYTFANYMRSNESLVDDDDYVQDMMAYLNRPKLDDIATVTRTLQSLIDKLSDKLSDHTLPMILERTKQTILKEFGVENKYYQTLTNFKDSLKDSMIHLNKTAILSH
jgi:hypothetical protein